MSEGLLVVIAKYKEDISWVGRLKRPYIIYNKNLDDYGKYSNNLPNDAREAHTFLYHVISNYNNLNEYTAFVQGNPFDHCPNFIKFINTFDGQHKYVALGKYWRHAYDTTINSVTDELVDFGKRVQIEIKFPVYFSPGGQFLAHRDIIRRTSKETYQKIFDMLTEQTPIGRQTMWDVEKATTQIFGYYNPDHFEFE